MVISQLIINIKKTRFVSDTIMHTHQTMKETIFSHSLRQADPTQFLEFHVKTREFSFLFEIMKFIPESSSSFLNTPTFYIWVHEVLSQQ